MEKIINVAIVAHVDAGKSTLVDALLSQCGALKTSEMDVHQIMDSNDLEKERGITIYSKNCSVRYKDYKINIVDTPGHADFSSEVERIIKTVDTVVLIVDSKEGPMPQTRFVLDKALKQNLNPILFINKIDKKDARIDDVVNMTFDLFCELGANEKQLDFPICYGSARDGIAKYEVEDDNKDITPILDTIIKHTSCYEGNEQDPVQMQISSLAYDDYLGRLGIGRISKGVLKSGQMVAISKNNGEVVNSRVGKIFVNEGIIRKEVKEARYGEIAIVQTISDISIGDTICDINHINPLPPIIIEEPTMSMNFLVNSSPFAGRSGKFLTNRHIKERLDRELETNVGLKVESLNGADGYKVSGRGELHLSILIEEMRREGYEFAVSKAEVIYKEDERGKKLEPMEICYIDVPDEFSGAIIEKLSNRKGELQGMAPINGGFTRLEFSIPSRGLIGYRGQFMTDTKGNGIMNTVFDDYGPFKGEIQYRKQGSLIAFEAGEAITYGLFNAQERGTLFIGPGEKVYSGMIVGQTGRAEDIEVNVCKTKHLSNTRTSSSDEALRLVPKKVLSLEQALEFIDTDELLEITPENLRIRKKILDPTLRKRANIRKNNK